MKAWLFIIAICLVSTSFALPRHFVYLHSIDPSIEQDMRYAGNHNLLGRPLHGYAANSCILTKPAAKALAKVQAQLRPLHLGLKVYDCYRPVAAVLDVLDWSRELSQQTMKAEFFPRVDKADLFEQGYFAFRSGHSRGSTVDLTIIPRPAKSPHSASHPTSLVACYAPYHQRFPDNGIDMGTGYDCLDATAEVFYPGMTNKILQHRMLLRDLMLQYGFKPYNKEWWHFELRHEPYNDTYFNFLVSAPI